MTLKSAVMALGVLGILARPVAAGDHPRSTAAASSELWSASYAIDGNAGTVWSSAYHSSSAISPGNEWIAVWWGGARSTNYVRLVPRMYNGASLCVPVYVSIFYSTSSGWVYLTSSNLAANLTPAGYTISFPSVSTDGVLVVADVLRDDGFGGYYFQLAEVYGGSADRYFGWNGSLETSPLPLQTTSIQAGQARQYVGCTYTATSADCPTSGAIAYIQSGHYGELYILGDEPDQSCTPPSTVASAYQSFVQTILSYDSTARFSPPGFAQPNGACGTGALHFTDYAQAFYNALSSPRRVDEWRFHAFGAAKSYFGTCSQWTDTIWDSWVNTAAEWANNHGAPMVLGSFGFPDAADAECDIVTTHNWEQHMLDKVLNDAGIVAAVWWSYNAGGAHPLKDTAEGTLYQSYLSR